ncbi:hypothetical protein ACFOYW_00490 [Gryllotalpicola reticulitermitis]|uniref:Uncharacterized protein n=1 Tax=Gryllotalpicola reticulitermitis TaxID=1184153 RepID=A0ABV8Q2F7_9MICO
MIVAGATRESAGAFAAAVREALSDLPTDEIDELTDGLEADLVERAEESGGTSTFGDPVAYAEELRSAAGLPPRGGPSTERRFVGEEIARLLAAGVKGVRANPAGAWLLDLLVALRPVWWVLRGWTVYQVVILVATGRSTGVVPIDPQLVGSTKLAGWVLLLACVLVSVQWGRGRWLPWRWLRVLLIASSIGTVLAFIPVCYAAINGTETAAEVNSASSSSIVPQGLYDNGNEVYNIYAYGADGKPLSDVRLFDQDGHALQTNPDPDANTTFDGTTANGQTLTLEPSQRADGVTAWQVYPLQSDGSSSVTAPFTQVQPLLPTSPDAAATPSPEPSASMNSSATPSPDTSR